MAASMDDRIRGEERRPPSVFSGPPRRPPSVFSHPVMHDQTGPLPVVEEVEFVDGVEQSLGLMTLRDAADLLGIPPAQLEQLVERRGIMHYSIDSVPMFDRADLEAWLAERPLIMPDTPRGRLAF